ncbi:MAG: hypothetical protein Pg6C_13660 [Treponemataceae bacterium]|nr:MAG: hypothetical protein Pg6C_13660 [Treponemataceae bacterium]
MKKVAALLFMVVVLCGSLSAFDITSYPPSVEGGNIIIEAGAGIDLMSSSYWKGQIPPIFVDADYLLPKIPLSLGLGVAFSTHKFDYNAWNIDITQTHLPIAFRAMWHWGFNTPRLDFYTGFTAGYQLVFLGGKDYEDYKDNSFIDSYLKWGEGFYYNIALGLRYYFGEAKKFGLKAEVGYPVQKLGLSIKL